MNDLLFGGLASAANVVCLERIVGFQSVRTGEFIASSTLFPVTCRLTLPVV
jgi:hypothetical protein